MKCVGGLNKNKKWLEDGKDLQRNFSQGERIYSDEGKSPTISSQSGGTAWVGNTLIKEHQQDAVQTPDAKATVLVAGTHGSAPHHTKTLIGERIRRLTETECERLQTVPDGYTNHVSSSQRYRMLGNGWTIDVIAYIFGFLKKELK